MPFHTGVFGNGTIYLTPPAKVPDGTRAYVYLMAEDEDPVSFYRRLVIVEPEDARLYNQLGLAQSEVGKLEDAEASFTRAASLDFTFAEAHFNLGRVLIRKKNMDGAVDAFHKATDLAPDNEVFYRHLVFALLYLERAADALTALLAGVKTAPRLRSWALDEPLLDPLHDDPRWLELTGNAAKAQQEAASPVDSEDDDAEDDDAVAEVEPEAAPEAEAASHA